MNDSSRSSSRKFRGDTRNIRNSERPLAYTLTQKELYERSKQAFRDYAGDGPEAAGKVANALECSKATAKNYLDGRNVPTGLYDLRAYHAIPQYTAMKRELAAMELDLDPRVQAKMVELAQLVMKHGGGQ